MSQAKKPGVVDLFNQGKDYADEGIPLLTTEDKKTSQKAAMRLVQGYGNGSKDSIFDIAKLDESAQGSHIRYMERAVIADVGIHLVTSSTEEMREGIFKEAHYPDLKAWFKGPHFKKLVEQRTQEKQIASRLKKFQESSGIPKKKGIFLDPQIAQRAIQADPRVQRLRESDSFALDDPYSSVPSLSKNFDINSGRDSSFVPLMAGPYNKQLYWADYMQMQALAFEAKCHNPLAARICALIPIFVLGKSVKATVVEATLIPGVKSPGKGFQSTSITPQGKPDSLDYKPIAQALLDEHWKKNGMRLRAKMILGDLVCFGEQFIRYYDAPWGLKVRQWDPSTVWEVVSDPDDYETEFLAYRQYPTRYQTWVNLPGVPTIKYIIQQVPAPLYYHMRINNVAGEMRGRSQLFPILGYLRRLKEFCDDRIIRNKVSNFFVMDVAVDGSEGDVQAAIQHFSQPPTPGSFFIHNKAATLTAINAKLGGIEARADWELLLNLISVGSGVAAQYLGMSAATKAGALVETEADVKTFENYQEIMEEFFQQDAERVFNRAKDMGKLPQHLHLTVEMTYPALSEENRSEKMKDFAFAESMSWITHSRAASMAAKELGITSYVYAQEQAAVAEEDSQKEFLINQTYAQILKGQVEAPAAPGANPEKPGGIGLQNTGGGSQAAPGVQSAEQAQSSDIATSVRWPDDPRRIAASIRESAFRIRFADPIAHRL